MMGGIDYHGALTPLEQACRIADEDILYVQDLMRTKTPRESLGRKVGIALRHLQFVWTVLMNRKRQLIVVRDYSNVPLAAVFPLVFYMRSRMVFVVNHNLQWTFGSTVERVAFKLLGHRGCRFAFLEQVTTGVLERYGINPRNSLALPHPVPDTVFKRHRLSGVKTIGMIGQFRPEKGVDEMLKVLVPLKEKYRILLGMPNPETFHRLSAWSGHSEFEVVDTSDHEKYQQTVAECDVILLNHPPEGYAYRASGLIADAAAAHVPVIVRNLPVLQHQISSPVPIGECFEELSEIPDCIDRVSLHMEKEEYDFEHYIRARNPEALARELDQLCSMTSSR